MTREELRVFFQDHFCGCGSPPAAAGALLNLLEIWNDHDRAMYLELPKLVQDDGCGWLLLYLIDRHMGLIEHGGGVKASWLDRKGKQVLEALRCEKDDSFESLFGDHCCHGYDVSDPTHDCSAFDAAQHKREEE